MNIAVIPARGGSKRIPRKNIRTFWGKPMIAWSIAAAREAGLFHRILVSTDDAEISRIAAMHGAEVPFVRPAELADDHASTIDVLRHATEWALGQGWTLNAVCCIYPTAPFLHAGDIQRGLQALDSGSWEYAFAAAHYSAPIFRSFRIDAYGGVEMFFPEHFPARSQDLPVAMHDAAQFYWGRPSAWLERKIIFARHSTAVVIPRWRVQDIDDEGDWVRAEMMAPLVMAKNTS